MKGVSLLGIHPQIHPKEGSHVATYSCLLPCLDHEPIQRLYQNYGHDGMDPAMFDLNYMLCSWPVDWFSSCLCCTKLHHYLPLGAPGVERLGHGFWDWQYLHKLGESFLRCQQGYIYVGVAQTHGTLRMRDKCQVYHFQVPFGPLAPE